MILAHSYAEPEIVHGVGDFKGTPVFSPTRPGRPRRTTSSSPVSRSSPRPPGSCRRRRWWSCPTAGRVAVSRIRSRAPTCATWTSARFAAQADTADIASKTFRLPEPRAWKSPQREADPALIQQDLGLVRQTMWNYAGIVRSSRRLARARRILLELREEVQAFYGDCRPSAHLIELRNAVQTALLVVHAAKLNPVSRGCHYMVDDD